MPPIGFPLLTESLSISLKTYHYNLNHRHKSKARSHFITTSVPGLISLCEFLSVRSSKREMENKKNADLSNYFQMPLHYPRYNRKDYEDMPEWKLDRLLMEYGLPAMGDLAYKREYAMGAFLWPDIVPTSCPKFTIIKSSSPPAPSVFGKCFFGVHLPLKKKKSGYISSAGWVTDPSTFY